MMMIGIHSPNFELLFLSFSSINPNVSPSSFFLDEMEFVITDEEVKVLIGRRKKIIIV